MKNSVRIIALIMAALFLLAIGYAIIAGVING